MSEAYRTLRGAIAGTEDPNLEPYFAYSATLRIFGTPSLDFEGLASNVSVAPTRLHRIGERKSANSPPWKEDSWFYESPLAETEHLSVHLDALWNVLRPHAEYLKQLKRSTDISIFCGYRSNIDHAGFEVPYSSLEIFTALELPFGVSVIIA